MTPWNLYRLTARDQQVDLLRPFSYQKRFVGLTINQGGLLFTTPSERLTLITAITVQATAGGGQKCQDFQFVWVTPGSVPSDVLGRLSGHFDAISGTSNAWGNFRITGNPVVFLPPNVEVYGTALFDLAVNDNAAIICVHGLIMPHGNFSQ